MEIIVNSWTLLYTTNIQIDFRILKTRKHTQYTIIITEIIIRIICNVLSKYRSFHYHTPLDALLTCKRYTMHYNCGVLLAGLERHGQISCPLHAQAWVDQETAMDGSFTFSWDVSELVSIVEGHACKCHKGVPGVLDKSSVRTTCILHI